MATALEALLVEDNDLSEKVGEKNQTLVCESNTMQKYYKYKLHYLKLLMSHINIVQQKVYARKSHR